MTRLSTTHIMSTKPASVVMGEMAIAAGYGGVGMTMCFADYPAPLLCELWKYFARSVDPSEVYHVRGQAEIRKIPDRVAGLRLVFVHSPSHHNATGWAVEMAMPVDGTPCPRPAILSRGTTGDVDEDPGVTLLLRCDTDERDAIARWLFAGNTLPASFASHAPSVALAVATDPLLSDVYSSRNSEAECWPKRFRDRQVLRGLLTGACLIRSANVGVQADQPLTLSLNDYELVRTHLMSPIVSPIDGQFDELAATMVNRANVYLGVKYGDDSSAQNPFYLPSDSPQQRRSDASAPHPLITRKELADLGNKQSGMVGRLIEYLQRTNEYDLFSRMGFVGPTPRQDNWRQESGASLATSLQGWSIKQVRTHFEGLQKAGLISAERERNNGPWLYALPEEITHHINPFQNLPTVAELRENDSPRN